MTEIKNLVKLFERYAHAQSYATAFTEILDLFLLPFKKCDSAEQQTTSLEFLQNHKQRDLLTSIFTKIGELSEGFCDPLGELYMQVLSNGHMGQFFTPEPICDMMAAISVGENSNPNQSVCDCACGSGRMLLAAAKINRHLHLYGADLDVTCCEMALLNMLLNSLTGEIAHMNSLTNEFYKGFKIETKLVGTHYYPYYVGFTDARQSRIWLHDLQGTEVKPKFDKPFEPIVHRSQSMVYKEVCFNALTAYIYLILKYLSHGRARNSQSSSKTTNRMV